ncbi:MAG: hypothetical protein ACUVQO_15495 [Leptodesmis sp.]
MYQLQQGSVVYWSLMDINEFESFIRDSIATALEHLQAITLLAEELETHSLAAGQTLQNVSRITEDFISQQRQEQSTSS